MKAARLVITAGALLAASACSDDGLGTRCKPTPVPCEGSGTNCGFDVAETYAYAGAADCPSGHACIVYHLDNDTNGTQVADPNVVCTSPGAPAGCVTEEAIERAIYCSCPCGRDGSDDRTGLCTCGDGMTCSSVGGGELRYCVRN